MTTTKKSTRKYYAANHHYDVRFCNDVTMLIRFDSKQVRDEFVDGERYDGCSFHLEAVTRDDARRHFPEAFRYDDHRDGLYTLDQRDWTVGKYGYSKGREVFGYDLN